MFRGVGGYLVAHLLATDPPSAGCLAERGNDQIEGGSDRRNPIEPRFLMPKVYRVDRDYMADEKVYITSSHYMADEKVYFVSRSDLADKKVYVVSRDYMADKKVYVVSRPELAD
jgi:hypothetical protein